jgi:hypothetical protein
VIDIEKVRRLRSTEKNMEKRIAQLEKIIHRQQFIEDRYEELMLSCRRCWRYYGADHELFTASMKAMDFLIRRHATEIDEMNEEDNDDRPDNLPSNAELKGGADAPSALSAVLGAGD